MNGWREKFDAIDRCTMTTHRGKYVSEQAEMRRLLDEYEARPFRLLMRKWAAKLRIAR